MKHLVNALAAFILVLAFNLPAIAQDEKSPALQAAPQGNAEVQSPAPEDEDQMASQAPGDMDDDDSPMCRMSGKNCSTMPEKPAGCMCGPNCGCANCMMKKSGMGMGMGMGMRGMGMGGMRGGMDMMTGPGMVRSCRMPDYYLRMRDFLNLSQEQVDNLKKLEMSMKRDAILKGAQVKALELDLSEIVNATDFKVNDAVSKLKEVEDARLELRTAMIKTAGSARDLLSPEQLDKLKDADLGDGGMCGNMRGVSGGMKDGMRKKMMEKMMPKGMAQ